MTVGRHRQFLHRPAASLSYGSAAGPASSPQFKPHERPSLMSTSNVPRGPGLFEITQADGGRMGSRAS